MLTPWWRYNDLGEKKYQAFYVHQGQIEANSPTYRNHLLEQYNSTYISTYIVVQCRLYTPAKYFISNVNS